MKNSIEKTTIREYGKFEFMFSTNNPEIIFKIDLLNTNIDDISSQIKEVMKIDFLDRAGVYFLRLEEGFYIGKAVNLRARLKEHLSKKSISSITFATYKNDIEILEDEQIKDLESLLISYAQEYGLKFHAALKNKKNESRKKRNHLDRRDNQIIARYIWNKFAQLNIDDILEETFSYKLEDSHENDRDIYNEKNKITKTLKSRNKLSDDEKKLINSRIIRVDLTKRKDLSKNKIFEYIPYREIPTSGYIKKRMEIFNKENAKICLFEYLYNGIGNSPVDSLLTDNLRSKGYITAVTLAYLNIETNGKARGTLLENMDKIKARELINNFIENNF